MRFVGLLALLACSCGRADGESVGGDLTCVVDVSLVRSLGWVERDASDEEALLATVALTRRRIDAYDLGLEVSGDVAARKLSLGPTQFLGFETRSLLMLELESIGRVEVYPVARPEDLGGGERLQEERAKLDDWRALHPTASLEAFNALRTRDNGPDRRLLWAKDKKSEDLVPLLLADRPSRSFGAAHFDSVQEWWDSGGNRNAMRLDPRDELEDEFERFSEALGDRSVAVLFEGSALLAETADQVWGGGFVLEEIDPAEVSRVRRAAQGPGPLRN